MVEEDDGLEKLGASELRHIVRMLRRTVRTQQEKIKCKQESLTEAVKQIVCYQEGRVDAEYHHSTRRHQCQFTFTDRMIECDPQSYMVMNVIKSHLERYILDYQCGATRCTGIEFPDPPLLQDGE